jgi:hypothetical protein
MNKPGELVVVVKKHSKPQQRFTQLKGVFSKYLDEDFAKKAAMAGVQDEFGDDAIEEEYDEEQEDGKSQEEITHELRAIELYLRELKNEDYSEDDCKRHAVALWNLGNLDHTPIDYEEVESIWRS